MSAVEALYYTDPMCAMSWAAEPARRRAERRFGGDVTLTYVMGGLAREFGPSSRSLREWLDACATSGMPLDPRIWLDVPPRGSYSACIAVVVAGEQESAGAYLRAAREAVALRRRPLDDASALVAVAREVPGLDVARFEVGLGSHGAPETFGSELSRTREGGSGLLPRLEVRAASGAAGASGAVLSGPALSDPDAWDRVLRDAGGQPSEQPAPDVVEALRTHGALATAELAALCELPGPTAPARLWALAEQWRIRAERFLGGELWMVA